MISAEKISDDSWQGLIKAIRGYVGRRVRDTADRDDLVQDVLLRIHRSRDDLADQTRPGPWIYRIANNAVIDHWRRKGRPAPASVEDTDVEVGAFPAELDDEDRLQETLAAYVAKRVSRLPSPYRQTLTLTELQGVSYPDAARMLGVSLAAVKSRVLRGRALLRQALVQCCELEMGPTGRVVDCIPRNTDPCADRCRQPHDGT